MTSWHSIFVSPRFITRALAPSVTTDFKFDYTPPIFQHLCNVNDIPAFQISSYIFILALEGNYLRRSAFCFDNTNCCCSLEFSSDLPFRLPRHLRIGRQIQVSLHMYDSDQGIAPRGGADINTSIPPRGVFLSLLNACFLCLFFWPSFFHGNIGCVLYVTTLTGHHLRH